MSSEGLYEGVRGGVSGAGENSRRNLPTIKCRNGMVEESQRRKSSNIFLGETVGMNHLTI